MHSLPIDRVLPALITAVKSHGAAVLVAPPGAGKTTRVPPALLDAGIAGDGRVLVLQPRRMAARATARRMAEERGSRLGGEVGYAIRFERRISDQTRIEVLTEGLLTRRLQHDPFLEGVGCVVLDEFHERSLHADLALAMLAEVRAEARPDLVVVAMSATLDAKPIATFLGDCPVIETEGRTYPVEIQWDTKVDKRRLDDRVSDAVRALLRGLPPATPQAPGHILVFLPGMAEIRWCARALGRLPNETRVLPLHGSLPAREQDLALAPSSFRKVILATNVAETSLTIDGIAAVIDSGLARQPRLDAALGVERLETVSISRASADQRAGRAGRTGPGVCRRLWLQDSHRGLRPFDPPALGQQDLTRLTLEVRAWGSDAERFGWFERPPRASLMHATDTLARIGAVDSGGLTEVGRALAKLPVHPRLGRVLLEGARQGVPRLGANVAALASERDILRQRGESVGDSDLDARLAVLDAIDGGRPRGQVERHFGADARALRQVIAVRDQLFRAITPDRRAQKNGKATTTNAAALVPSLLLSGFPDRVARRRAPQSAKLVMTGGRGAVLDARSCVRDAQVLLAIHMGANDRGRDPTVYSAIALDPSTLPTTDVLVTSFDMASEAAVQHLERRYLDLSLAQRPSGKRRDAAAMATCLATATRNQPARALQRSEETTAWLTRLRWLALTLPDEGIPTLPELDGDHSAHDAGEADVFDVLCADRRSWAQLRRLDLAAELQNTLPWPIQQLLTTEAPERWKLPCGVQARVRYALDRPPVVSAKAQHFFGMAASPRLARGRATAACELLAPNGRPTQVTSDLAGFWTSSWLEVRKDLRGRYPKHPWPEVPTLEDARKGRRRRSP